MSEPDAIAAEPHVDAHTGSLADPAAVALERMKSQLAHDLAHYQGQVAQSIETHKPQLQATNNHEASERENERASFRATIEFALLVIRSLVLVNGGAAIGVITYLGHLWSKTPESALASAMVVQHGLYAFVAGLALALLTAGCSYIAQALYSELDRHGGKTSPAASKGNRWRYAGVACAALSLGAFIAGAYLSAQAVKSPAMLG
jgi:hypothetical protein